MQRVLVLNQDFSFLGVTSWENAITATYCGKAVAVENYDQEVHSPSITMKIPAVIRLKKFIHIAYERLTFVSFTKRNVHLRDSYNCQYCSKHCERGNVGIDHIFPESRGGKSVWTNVVTCCHSCNLTKDNKTPEEAGMKLIKLPTKPKGFRTIIKIKLGEIHDLWEKYL
jgi:5-methylcytosine-specific restriction endonuclease McrA